MSADLETYTCAKGHTGTPLMKKDGYPRCKECHRIQDRKYKAAHLELADKNRDSIRFGKLRETTIQRDGEKCVDCGMTRAEHIAKWGCDITVNHIDGNGRFAKVKNNDPSNLETLCLSCHTRKDNIRRNAA